MADEKAMRQVCLELNLLSEVPSAPIGRSSPSADRDYGLRGEKTSLGDVWWNYYQQCPDDTERLRVFHRARGVLARQKGRKPNPLDEDGNPLTDEEWDRYIFEVYGPDERVEYIAVCEAVSYRTVERSRRRLLQAAEEDKDFAKALDK